MAHFPRPVDQAQQEVIVLGSRRAGPEPTDQAHELRAVHAQLPEIGIGPEIVGRPVRLEERAVAAPAGVEAILVRVEDIGPRVALGRGADGGQRLRSQLAVGGEHGEEVAPGDGQGAVQAGDGFSSAVDEAQAGVALRPGAERRAHLAGGPVVGDRHHLAQVPRWPATESSRRARASRVVSVPGADENAGRRGPLRDRERGRGRSGPGGDAAPVPPDPVAVPEVAAALGVDGGRGLREHARQPVAPQRMPGPPRRPREECRKRGHQMQGGVVQNHDLTRVGPLHLERDLDRLTPESPEEDPPFLSGPASRSRPPRGHHGDRPRAPAASASDGQRYDLGPRRRLSLPVETQPGREPDMSLRAHREAHGTVR